MAECRRHRRHRSDEQRRVSEQPDDQSTFVDSVRRVRSTGPTTTASGCWGWLKPEQTGDYTFWIAGDDAQELWLSTDGSPTNAVMIANVTGWTDGMDWDNTGGARAPSQKSAAIKLEAGKKYFIMALGKEGGGGDSTAVAWQGPGIAARALHRGQVRGHVLPGAAAGVRPGSGQRRGRYRPDAGPELDRRRARPRSMRSISAMTRPPWPPPTSKSPLFKGSQTGTTFNAGDLEWGKTYYWRVDETNAGEADSPWKGTVWSFTTANFIPVDNFESYTDDLDAKTTHLRHLDRRRDRWQEQLHRRQLRRLRSPSRRSSTAASSRCRWTYDNSKTPFFSEAMQEFAPLQNWTVNGVDDLSLWAPRLSGGSVAVTETPADHPGQRRRHGHLEQLRSVHVMPTRPSTAMVPSRRRVVSIARLQHVGQGRRDDSRQPQWRLAACHHGGDLGQCAPHATDAVSTRAMSHREHRPGNPAGIKAPYWVTIDSLRATRSRRVSRDGKTWRPMVAAPRDVFARYRR